MMCATSSSSEIAVNSRRPLRYFSTCLSHYVVKETYTEVTEEFAEITEGAEPLKP